MGKVLSSFLAPEVPAMSPLGTPQSLRAAEPQNCSSAALPSNRLTTSIFVVDDSRNEYNAEQRADADELDRRAAALISEAEVQAAALLAQAHKNAATMIHTALSLRISADHMEANPPD